MLASDSRIGFLCYFFFNIEYYYRHYFVPAFAIQSNIFWNSIISKEKKASFFTIIKCYSKLSGVYKMQIADFKQAVLDCRSSTDSYFCTHDENQT